MHLQVPEHGVELGRAVEERPAAHREHGAEVTGRPAQDGRQSGGGDLAAEEGQGLGPPDGAAGVQGDPDVDRALGEGEKALLGGKAHDLKVVGQIPPHTRG